jgi:hypothetical protein
MKLRNKITGEIKNFDDIQISLYIGGQQSGPFYDSIAELNEEWEDYEEPKEYWCMTSVGKVYSSTNYRVSDIRLYKEIGNYFETKEEAEKAVEKLRAWKRLTDKGFRFVGWQDSVSDNNPDMALFKLDEDAWETDTCDDLDLLFSQEDDKKEG